MFSGLSPDNKYAVYQHNLSTMIRTITERLAFVPVGNGFEVTPRPKPLTFNALMKPFQLKFQKYIRYSTPITREKFVSYYVGRKRKLYEAAAASLLDEGLTQKDFIIDYFLKTEFYNLLKKSDPANRLISPHNSRANVELGTYIKVIEKTCYKIIETIFDSITVFKCLNPLQAGQEFHNQWKFFTSPCAVGLDAKRFDQHVSKTALVWETNLYRRFFPGDKKLDWMLKQQYNQSGRAFFHDGHLTYKQEGGRASGVQNTGLGNCILMCAMVYNFFIWISTRLGREIKYKLANNGDDCVVIMESEDEWIIARYLSHFFLKLGFRMEIEPTVYVFEEIEFCQAHPVWTVDGYVMTRNPHSAISKDVISIKPFDGTNNARSWAKCVALGGLSLTGSLPVWQSFYQVLERYGKNAKEYKDDRNQIGGLFWMAKDMKRRAGPVHSKSRHSFFLAFGITPDQQIAVEDYYDRFSLTMYNGGSYHKQLFSEPTVKS